MSFRDWWGAVRRCLASSIDYARKFSVEFIHVSPAGPPTWIGIFVSLGAFMVTRLARGDAAALSEGLSVAALLFTVAFHIRTTLVALRRPFDLSVSVREKAAYLTIKNRAGKTLTQCVLRILTATPFVRAAGHVLARDFSLVAGEPREISIARLWPGERGIFLSGEIGGYLDEASRLLVPGVEHVLTVVLACEGAPATRGTLRLWADRDGLNCLMT